MFNWVWISLFMQLNVVWPSLIKWSSTTMVLRLKGIQYHSIVARGLLKTLAYHSLPKYDIKSKKYGNLETKCVTTSPGVPYTYVFCLRLIPRLMLAWRSAASLRTIQRDYRYSDEGSRGEDSTSLTPGLLG